VKEPATPIKNGTEQIISPKSCIKHEKRESYMFNDYSNPTIKKNRLLELSEKSTRYYNRSPAIGYEHRNGYETPEKKHQHNCDDNVSVHSSSSNSSNSF